ncbi:hypothetical protein MRX96_007387 [Rhipicephalus microplus]
MSKRRADAYSYAFPLRRQRKAALTLTKSFALALQHLLSEGRTLGPNERALEHAPRTESSRVPEENASWVTGCEIHKTEIEAVLLAPPYICHATGPVVDKPKARPSHLVRRRLASTCLRAVRTAWRGTARRTAGKVRPLLGGLVPRGTKDERMIIDRSNNEKREERKVFILPLYAPACAKRIAFLDNCQ